MPVLSLRVSGSSRTRGPFVIRVARTDSVPSGWSTTYNQLEDISAPNRESTIEFASPRSGSSDRPGSRSASYV
jgi:hypothetical protein